MEKNRTRILVARRDRVGLEVVDKGLLPFIGNTLCLQTAIQDFIKIKFWSSWTIYDLWLKIVGPRKIYDFSFFSI